MHSAATSLLELKNTHRRQLSSGFDAKTCWQSMPLTASGKAPLASDPLPEESPCALLAGVL